ncbi:hypothetical protein PZB74_14035 [Porifericola rhodea]|uniref:hypothetical protein n=1 Tax=Porifericola rhodea TaxID=930972 RepID=UPI002666A42F|nr:hypothetical protein [Porifericola rhodea]WKN30080.1 hypothetical protein PZB74_14035 [Porifericola rhodea]
MRRIFAIALLLCCGFSCEEVLVANEEVIKMMYAETGCANPWEMTRDEAQYQKNIKAYLLQNNVKALNIEVLHELPEDMSVCYACHCWSGRNIYIDIASDQKNAAEKLGFELAKR